MAHLTIRRLLDEAAERFADRTAVLDGAQRRSYAELVARVDARSRHWQALGIGSGERIAVLDWNTEAFLECYFAAATLGAILAPLNHRLALPELVEILADCEARVLVCGRPFGELAQRLRASATAVEHHLWAEDQPPTTREPLRVADVTPDDVAHLYYTSGTTGRPKGVQLTHRNVCVHAGSAVHELALDERDRWGHFAPMFHLADAWACFAITAVGGVHVLAPRFEPEGALALVIEAGITITNLSRRC